MGSSSSTVDHHRSPSCSVQRLGLMSFWPPKSGSRAACRLSPRAARSRCRASRSRCLWASSSAARSCLALALAAFLASAARRTASASLSAASRETLARAILFFSARACAAAESVASRSARAAASNPADSSCPNAQAAFSRRAASSSRCSACASSCLLIRAACSCLVACRASRVWSSWFRAAAASAAARSFWRWRCRRLFSARALGGVTSAVSVSGGVAPGSLARAAWARVCPGLAIGSLASPLSPPTSRVPSPALPCTAPV
mmetsp:Transcript_11144/g.31985  ORF Transcript_11144/g.31985 Transcript_11144/m.31985 type:complete len:261 (+) Transcript_11144:1017-1799(+)